ncbi:hypothetical protein ACOMHN_060067 [Nucella lapillus]
MTARAVIGVLVAFCGLWPCQARQCQPPEALIFPTSSVCLFNAKSVGVARKRTAIMDFLADHDVDVMVLTETWLKDSGDESKIADLTPPGYKLFSFSVS